jgi:hypothetical protein
MMSVIGFASMRPTHKTHFANQLALAGLSSELGAHFQGLALLCVLWSWLIQGVTAGSFLLLRIHLGLIPLVVYFFLIRARWRIYSLIIINFPKHARGSFSWHCGAADLICASSVSVQAKTFTAVFQSAPDGWMRDWHVHLRSNY